MAHISVMRVTTPMIRALYLGTSIFCSSTGLPYCERITEAPVSHLIPVAICRESSRAASNVCHTIMMHITQTHGVTLSQKCAESLPEKNQYNRAPTNSPPSISFSFIVLKNPAMKASTNCAISDGAISQNCTTLHEMHNPD